MIRFNALPALFLALGLVSCAQVPTATLFPTQAVVRVYFDPAVMPLEPALRACIAGQPETALDIQPFSTYETLVSTNGILFSVGEPDNGMKFAAQVASDELVVILNPANTVNKLSTADLARIFTGQTTNWETAGGSPYPIHTWLYPTGTLIYRTFEAGLLSGSANNLDHPEAYLAPSSEAMREAVATDPGAIGYLPYSWVDESVQVAEIEVELSTAFRYPILAAAASEPAGAALALIGCLQGKTGRELLREVYPPWNFSPLP